MKIEKFKIQTGMGKSNDWEELGITKEQHEFLNNIGYSGTTKMKYTYEEYLNEIHGDKYEYIVVYEGGRSDTYTENYLVIRTLKKATFIIFNGFYSDRNSFLVTDNKEKAIDKFFYDGTYLEVWKNEKILFLIELYDEENKKNHEKDSIIEMLKEV